MPQYTLVCSELIAAGIRSTLKTHGWAMTLAELTSKNMTKGYLNWCGSIAVFCCAVFLIGGIDQTTQDALKVKHILRTIERTPPRSDSQALSAELTEQEVNAYIAHRLAQEKNPLFNSLSITLLENNHVRGRLTFDAQRLNLDSLIGENLDFDFKGILNTRDGAARLDLISLHLGGQPVKPQVLDFVLGTAALVYGTDSGGIGDWYELPKGIKRISVDKARAVLFY